MLSISSITILVINKKFLIKLNNQNNKNKVILSNNKRFICFLLEIIIAGFSILIRVNIIISSKKNRKESKRDHKNMGNERSISDFANQLQ
jgi:hypothetical protein